MGVIGKPRREIHIPVTEPAPAVPVTEPAAPPVPAEAPTPVEVPTPVPTGAR
jgi:hypothetical protein